MEVVRFKPKTPEKPQPDPHVVKRLTAMLEQAQAGDLRAFGYVCETNAGLSYDTVGLFSCVTQTLGLAHRLVNLVDSLDDEDDE